MAERLARETSPYLRQHADNPVDWFPWGDQAFEVATDRDVPVLLSVGYSACHWCHVMAHESFEDPEIARVMNERFVNVKVDREERPDVDAIYMEATRAMTGAGGWPMTVLMTASGEPFFCGTYFPPEPRPGQPSFRQLLDAVHEAWTERRTELLEQADRLTHAVRRVPVAVEGSELPGTATLDEATMSALAAHDARSGGFGAAPKFPHAMGIGHLLRHHRRTGSTAALDAALGSLDAMAAGGIHDHLGGGFARYSVDQRWLVPHFEKMLYDNALLARTYLWAWQLSGLDRFLSVVDTTLDFVLEELSTPDGGRHSALDADSLPSEDAEQAVEGAAYTWTPAQVRTALEAAGLAAHTTEALEWFGITERGHVEGASVPNRLHAVGRLERTDTISAVSTALLAARRRRPQPTVDDKVLTEWNALAITALADAAAATGRRDRLDAAIDTATFLLDRLRRDDGRWLRSWQADADGGRARHLAYAADHAALVEAFLALYEASGEPRWLTEAVTNADTLIDLFWDTDGGVWTTGDDAEPLVARPKDITDDATPSANSSAAVALRRLAAHTGEHRYAEHSRTVLRAVGGVAARHPLAFGHLLWAVELDALGVTEVVVSGDRPDLVAEVRRGFRPNVVLAWGPATGAPLWDGRDESGADGRAYVCRNQVCAAPVTDAAALRELLDPNG